MVAPFRRRRWLALQAFSPPMPPGTPGAFSGAQRNEGWRGEGWRGEDWRSRAKNSDTYEWTSKWGRRPAGPEAEVSSQFGRSRSPVGEGDFADTLGRLGLGETQRATLASANFCSQERDGNCKWLPKCPPLPPAASDAGPRLFSPLVLQGLHLAHLRVLTTDPTGWQFSSVSRTDANSVCSRSLDRQLHSAQETV
jgi:hypothetical protein